MGQRISRNLKGKNSLERRRFLWEDNVQMNEEETWPGDVE